MKMMYSCQEVPEIASDYLEGRLSWSEWAMLKMHLAMCPPCRDYVEQLGLTVEALEALDEPPSPEVSRDLMAIYHHWTTEQDS